MMPVPLRTPLAVRVLRLIVRGVLVLVGLGVVINVAAWIVAHQSTVTIDKEHPYEWRSGAPIYLAADQTQRVWCKVTADDATVNEVVLPGILDLSVPGRRLNPPSTPLPEVTCDGEVTVSSGRVLLLYEVASWPWFMPVGFLGCLLCTFGLWLGLGTFARRMRSRWGRDALR